MADEATATVHQGATSKGLGRGTKGLRALVNRDLSQHKLLYGLTFLGLIGGSVLYFNLGANAQNNPQPASNSNVNDSSSTTESTKDESPSNGDSSMDVNLNTSQTSQEGQSTSNTTLNVNGEDIPVHGSHIHKTFHSSDGNTTVEINSNNSTSNEGGGDY
jgi:hypothetical protein